MNVSPKKIARGNLVVPSKLDAGMALFEILKACREYINVREENQTKRTAIAAQAGIELERIRSQERVVMSYLELTFSERSANFKALFNALERAGDAGDATTMAATLEAVIALAKQSPLADVANLDQVKRALDDPNHVFTI